ncbi:ImmA/IrrE family metallo-endopeptidase [Microbacterium sp.]|uniref:ImmA/IrrE family metallo-endopeptidase n=1 Tax=Microbacterium sp. TaxID=51671 RepID=UPI0028121AA4|nr:ImmA/IrrE family metallo-endopeptidase [Microbacterium sp.]
MAEDQVIARVNDVIERSSLTKKDFASAIGIDGPKLAKSLAGKRRFTSLELALVAEQGGTTVDWLLNGDSTRELVLAHRAAEHAIEASDLVGRETIEMLVEKLEGLQFLGRPLPFPSLPAKPTAGGYVNQAQKLAHEYVQLLESPVGGLTNSGLIGRIEEKFGVDVVVTGLPDACDGLSFSDGGVRAIVLATSDAPFRQRFTLAHELAHLAFGDSQDEVIEEQLWTKKTQAESRANTFAASFLAPRAEIVARIAKRSAVDAFDDLVLHFQMSPSAMSWRLLNEQLISQEDQRRLESHTARATAMRAGEAAEHTNRARLARVPRPAQRLVDAYLDAYRDGAATLRPAASLLGQPAEELEEYFFDTASADDSALHFV